MTSLAIGVKGARHVGVINRNRGAAVAGLVCMLVMPDMFRASDRGLVPAINRSPSPCELKRYHDEQENDQPVTHRSDSSGALRPTHGLHRSRKVHEPRAAANPFFMDVGRNPSNRR